jgi:hypothetical protein
MNNTNSIEKVIKKGLETPIFDTIEDYAELALDSFIHDEIIREIPIVKSIVGVVKSGFKIREIFFAKKLLTFLSTYHNGTLKREIRDSFISKFNSDSNYRSAVVEQIMVLNDRFLEVNKSKIYANLFMSHLNEKFDWNTFRSLAHSLEVLNLFAIDYLDKLANIQNPEMKFKGDIYPAKSTEASFLISAGLAVLWSTRLHVNNHGQYLYYYGVKGDIDFVFSK